MKLTKTEHAELYHWRHCLLPPLQFTSFREDYWLTSLCAKSRKQVIHVLFSFVKALFVTRILNEIATYIPVMYCLVETLHKKDNFVMMYIINCFGYSLHNQKHFMCALAKKLQFSNLEFRDSLLHLFMNYVIIRIYYNLPNAFEGSPNPFLSQLSHSFQFKYI